MQLTIIISYYKALNNLALILKALNEQNNLAFEVIISEDDNNKETLDFIKKNRDALMFPLIHLQQAKDDGFRKNQMLNKCIMAANTAMIAFIDGDCIPHPHFADQYIKNIKPNRFYSGRAVMLSPDVSKAVVQTHDLSKLGFVPLLLSKSSPIKDAIYSPYLPLSLVPRGIVGRNWGIMISELKKINGFDEDYIKAGIGEDTDVEWRLRRSGLRCVSMKNKAIVYHIHHQPNYSVDDVNHNIKLLVAKQSKGSVFCINGLSKSNQI